MLSRNKTLRLFYTLSLAALLTALAQGAAHAQTPKPPQVTVAQWNTPATGKLTIIGYHFGPATGPAPVVKLTGAALTVDTFTDNRIVAFTPSPERQPGNFYITVTNTTTNLETTFIVTVGAVGPAGPQGIQGIQGVKGDKGDKGNPGSQGALNGMKEFTEGGEFVVPAGVDHVMVELWGAGGGGGGGNNQADSQHTGSAGGGGGGGAYSRSIISVTPGQTLSVVVGAAGAGGAVDTDGGDGGDTQLKDGDTVLLFAGGGKGGAQGVLNGEYPFGTTPPEGGAGGGAGQGDPAAAIKRAGASGFAGARGIDSYPGDGGSSCSGASIYPWRGGINTGSFGMGGKSINGTIESPGSTGGTGGNGSQLDTRTGPCGYSGKTPMAATQGAAGTPGYAVLTW